MIALLSTETPRFTVPLSVSDAERQARLLKALSDPMRLRILSVLSCYEGTICVEELAKAMGLSQPTVSHHLRILLDARMITRQKHGLAVYYAPHRGRIARVAAAMIGIVDERVEGGAM